MRQIPGTHSPENCRNGVGARDPIAVRAALLLPFAGRGILP